LLGTHLLRTLAASYIAQAERSLPALQRLILLVEGRELSDCLLLAELKLLVQV
jgi:hypothetical protein